MARQRGNQLGFWFFRMALRLTGLRGAYGLLHLVCLHYLLFDRTAVAAAAAYLRRRFPEHRGWRLRLDVYRLFVEQGKNLVDRYYLLAGGRGIRITIDGLERMRELTRSGRGFILLTAHVGNWQAALQALDGLEASVYLLMRPEENRAVLENLKITQGAGRIQVISAENFLDEVPVLVRVLDAGGILSIMGDRSYGAPTVPVRFFGADAQFPYSAFGIAAAVGCPVVVLLSAKVAAREYRVTVADLFSPAYERGTPRREQLAGWVRRYAAVLEEFATRNPFQCFLFHDPWGGAERRE